MTLVCHHPEVASNPGRYFSTQPVWRENGVRITPSTGIYSTSDTSEDLTHTTLTIRITVDHFRNKSFDYSCLLALAENGLPTGEVETSENVTVDPVGECVYIATLLFHSTYIMCTAIPHAVYVHAYVCLNMWYVHTYLISLFFCILATQHCLPCLYTLVHVHMYECTCAMP